MNNIQQQFPDLDTFGYRDEPKLIKRYFIWYPRALVKYMYDSYNYNKFKGGN